MIDIDIAQQLFPNPFTVLVQLASTAVLFYFVKKYLWGPARKMMEERSNKIQAKYDDAESYLNEAKKSNEDAKLKVQEAYQTSKEMINNAEEQGKKIKDEIISKAQDEAQDKLTKARELIKVEKQQMRDEVVEEMVNVALYASEKLIGEKVDQESDVKAIKKFVDEVNSKDEPIV